MRGWRAILAVATPLHSQFQEALRNPREIQLRLLRHIIELNARTHFGRTFQFDRISSVEDYQRIVPIQTYEESSSWIERCAAGESGVITSDPIIAFEETGGSSAGPKLIPYTQGSLDGFRSAVLPWIADLLARRPAIAEGRAYVSVSPATGKRRMTKGGHPIGLPSEGDYLGADLADAFREILMKSDDYYFVGFPALWNVVVLYFYILDTPWIVNFVTIAALSVLTFVPIKYVHPLRVADWREITIPITVLWAALSLSLVISAKDRSAWGTVETIELWIWVAASLYFAGISLWRSFFKKPEEADEGHPHAT